MSFLHELQTMLSLVSAKETKRNAILRRREKVLVESVLGNGMVLEPEVELTADVTTDESAEEEVSFA